MPAPSEQKRGVDLPECREGFGSTLGPEAAEDNAEPPGVDGGDRPDQALVDPRNQRDRPAGDAGDCIRRPHTEAAEVDTCQLAECRHYQPVGDREHW